MVLGCWTRLATTLVSFTRPLRLYFLLLLVTHGFLGSNSFEIARNKMLSRLAGILGNQQPSNRHTSRLNAPPPQVLVSFLFPAPKPGIDVALKDHLSRLHKDSRTNGPWSPSPKKHNWNINPNYSRAEDPFSSDPKDAREGHMDDEDDFYEDDADYYGPTLNYDSPRTRQLTSSSSLWSQLTSPSSAFSSQNSDSTRLHSSSSSHSSFSSSPAASSSTLHSKIHPSPATQTLGDHHSSSSSSASPSSSPSSASSSSASAPSSTSFSSSFPSPPYSSSSSYPSSSSSLPSLSSSTSSSSSSSTLPLLSSSPFDSDYDSFPESPEEKAKECFEAFSKEKQAPRTAHRECNAELRRNYCLNGGTCVHLPIMENDHTCM